MVPLYVLPGGLWDGSRDPHRETQKKIEKRIGWFLVGICPYKGLAMAAMGYDITLTRILNRVLKINNKS